MNIVSLALCLCGFSTFEFTPQDPIAHWQFSADRYQSGQFQTLAGPWIARVESDPAWLGTVGEDSASAMLFESGTSGMQLAAAVSLKELPSKKLSVAAWVALDQAGDWGGFVSCIQDNGSHERGWVLGNRGRKFCFAVATASSQKLNYMTGDKNLVLGRWAHIVGVYDGRSQRLYVDGEMVAEAKERASSILYDPTHELVLGAYKDSNENYPMVGAFWEARIYDRALSTKQIKKLFREGRDRLPPIKGTRATQGATAPDIGELQPKVNRAIDDGVHWLLNRQNRDGSWNERTTQYRNGITSLCALALLKSGVPSNHPAIQNAKRFLLQVQPRYTYSAALQLMFFAELRDTTVHAAAEDAVQLLLSWEKRSPRGAWGYPNGPADLSNTQFAALGLWAAERMNIKLPDKLWVNMVETTVRYYMKGREIVEVVQKDGRRLKKEIEGFAYFANDTQYPAYGGMVVAGLGVIGLAEQVGTKLPADLKRQTEKAKERALGWLTHYFRVDAVPGYPERLQYFLYGLERVGSLLDMHTFGPHEWYREGAAYLVKTQQNDGSWYHTEYGTHYECATGFALLFLTRATSPTTSSEAPRNPRTGVYELKEGAVHLRATGLQPLTVWVTGVVRPDGQPVDQAREPEAQISQVSYLLNGELAGIVTAEESSDERFATKLPIPVPGNYVLMVEVTCQDGEQIYSDALQMSIERSAEAFQRQALALRGQNLLALMQPQVEVSSTKGPNWAGEQAIDLFQGTAWVHAKEDPAPWIRFLCARSVKARRLVLSPADAKPIHANRASHIQKVRIILNDDVDEAIVADWPVDPLAECVIPLPGRTGVRSLQIEILQESSANTKWQKESGFAEVGLFLQ